MPAHRLSESDADDDRIYEDRLHRQERRASELAEISKALANARRFVDIARKRQKRAVEKGEWEPTAQIRGDARVVRLYLRDALAVLDGIIEER